MRAKRRPGDPMGLVADSMLVPWFESRLVLDPAIARFVRPVPVHPPLDSWPLGEAAHVIERAFRGIPVRLVVVGPPGSGRSTLAAVAAQRLGITCIAVDTTAITEEEWANVFLGAVALCSVRTLWRHLDGEQHESSLAAKRRRFVGACDYL